MSSGTDDTAAAAAASVRGLVPAGSDTLVVLLSTQLRLEPFQAHDFPEGLHTRSQGACGTTHVARVPTGWELVPVRYQRAAAA